jgi:hypothetical protein
MNVEGIRRVMYLEAEVVRLRNEVDQLRLLAAQAIHAVQVRPSTPPSQANIVPLRQAVTVFGHVDSVLRRD